MSVVKFVKPKLSLMKQIADDMRQDDIDEVWSSHHLSPMNALIDGVCESEICVIVTINNNPVVMLGLVIRNAVLGIGSPWLLGTNAALQHKREFIKNIDGVIDDMLNICPSLTNYVHVNNKKSIRWLKRIGFIIEKPARYGLENEFFHRFHLEGGLNV